MSNKYNQFAARRMQPEQPDLEKLIKFASLLRKEYGFKVDREPILLFSKHDGHLIKCTDWISKQEYEQNTIHTPDIVFWDANTLHMWIVEVDGLIHHKRTNVARKDRWRNADYKRAKLSFIIIDEWSIIEREMLEEKPLTALQVFAEFQSVWEKIKLVV